MRLLLLFLLLPLFAFGQNYMTVESVEYDASQNRWLAGNGNSIIARAADGELSFFGNATATHGLEIMGTSLYAIGSNVLRAYDLETEAEIFSYSIPGVSFLNGITNDGNGKLYITDFSAGKIYLVDVSDMDNVSHEVIVENTNGTPNGVLYVADPTPHLLFVTWGANAEIRAVDLSDNTFSTVTGTDVGSIDGIDDDAVGNIYISSWQPARITKYDPTFTNPAEIVSTPFINNPADIGYSQVTDTLAIPIGQNVVYVGLGVVSGIEETLTSMYQLNVYPNPVGQRSIVQFQLAQASQAKLKIYDLQGRLVETLANHKHQAGKHQVVLAGMQVPANTYILTLEVNGHKESIPIIVVD